MAGPHPAIDDLKVDLLLRKQQHSTLGIDQRWNVGITFHETTHLSSERQILLREWTRADFGRVND